MNNKIIFVISVVSFIFLTGYSNECGPLIQNKSDTFVIHLQKDKMCIYGKAAFNVMLGVMILNYTRINFFYLRNDWADDSTKDNLSGFPLESLIFDSRHHNRFITMLIAGGTGMRFLYRGCKEAYQEWNKENLL